MKRILGVILILALLAGSVASFFGSISPAAAQGVVVSDGAPEIVVGPYTQNVTEDSVTILWETSLPTASNSVEYGPTSEYGYSENLDVLSDHHEITISPAFTSGHYKVVSDSIESEDLEFKTAAHGYSTGEFRLAIFGDSRGEWDGWVNATAVANAVNAAQPDLVIHTGDMVDDGTIESQWDTWLGLMRPLMQNSTVFGVLGNHENNAPRYFEIFALPNNEKWYSFDYGPCHFTILDNYESWDVASPQYEWLDADLSSTVKPFKIVCFHEPIYCSGGHPPREDVRAAWEPLFINYNVNLVFSGHCHYYQRTIPINGITHIVTAGGGAPLHTPTDDWFVDISQRVYHYCLLVISLETMEMRVTAHYVDGTTFDELIISPPSVTTSDASDITDSSAILNGNLDDLGTASDVDASFEWGETTAYGNETTPEAMPTTGPFSFSLPSLSPDTIYHFRAKAVGDGISYGDDMSFTTEPAPGLLRVETSPAVATTISVDGIPRNDWGLDWVKMPPGEYTISASDVPEHLTPVGVEVTYYPEEGDPVTQTQPLSQPVAVNSEVTTGVVISFIPLGYLRVEISPVLSVAPTIFVEGNPMNDWGLWVSLEAGEYTVSFQEMDGYQTPSPIVVTVNPGETTHVTGVYEPL